ncbi:MAG: hypothetical protein ACO2ZK_09380 [Gemmobacter sp.]
MTYEDAIDALVGRGLNARQARFVAILVGDGEKDQTAAYIAAGFKDSASAKPSASKMRRRMQEHIAWLRRRYAEHVPFDPPAVARRLWQIAEDEDAPASARVSALKICHDIASASTGPEEMQPAVLIVPAAEAGIPDEVVTVEGGVDDL